MKSDKLKIDKWCHLSHRQVGLKIRSLKMIKIRECELLERSEFDRPLDFVLLHRYVVLAASITENL